MKYFKLFFIFLFSYISSAVAQDICILNVEAMPLRMIDKPPVYPGCVNINTKEEAIDCMDEKLQAFFEDNFRAKDDSFDQSIILLNIDKNGCIDKIGVKAKTPALEKEAIRVINLIPQMKPGMNQGEEVKVLYSLLIGSG